MVFPQVVNRFRNGGGVESDEDRFIVVRIKNAVCQVGSDDIEISDDKSFLRSTGTLVGSNDGV